ncbi:MAG: TerB family tellurite resistance protein [Candidatus Omnitrophota bacterium]
MAGFLARLRRKILSPFKKGDPDGLDRISIDDKIALGVFMWDVARVDKKFSSEEKEKIGEILKSVTNISQEDMAIILRAIEIAAMEKIDLHKFTREVSNNLPYPAKVNIIENLFRVAYVDHKLTHEEEEIICKISKMLSLDRKDFLSAKIKIRNESGRENLQL